MSHWFQNTYVRVGGAVAVLAFSLYVGFRYAFSRAMKGKVIIGEPVPQLSKSFLKGKRVLAVGGTNGLGLAISQELVKNGASVEIVGRSDPKDPTLKFYLADLATVKAQTELAELIANPQSLDILLFTQGILAPPKRTDNGEGIELDLAVSYLGRRVILEKLLERGATPNRVFIMGFSGSEQKIEDFNGETKYNVNQQHMNTIAANDALVLGYRKRRPNLAIYGLNPGLIKTGIRANLYAGNKLFEAFTETLIGMLAPTPTQYAQKIVNVIGADPLSKTAVFFNANGEAIAASNYLSDEKNVEKIWTDSDRLIERAKGANAKKNN